MSSYNFNARTDPDVNKDISSGKMLESIATVEVQIKHTFFAFIPHIYLLVGSQGSTMFFLELLMD